jgi:hypothetical protein
LHRKLEGKKVACTRLVPDTETGVARTIMLVLRGGMYWTIDVWVRVEGRNTGTTVRERKKFFRLFIEYFVNKEKKN